MKKYRKAKSKYIAVCSLTLWLYQPVNAQIEITTLPDSCLLYTSDAADEL